MIQQDIDPPPGNLVAKLSENNVFRDLASSLEGSLSELFDCSDEAQEKYLKHEVVSENVADHAMNTQYYHDHRDVYDPITKGQYGLYEKPELLAAYFHDLNLDYINNEEQTREQLCLTHTDPAWSTEQCDMHIMMEELNILNRSRYNEYFINYNDVINTCINYHTSPDISDDYVEGKAKMGAKSPMKLDISPDQSSKKDSEHPKGDKKTVCKNPLEIPEQQKDNTAAELIYSQSATADVINKRYVSAIEIPMGNCKDVKNESPIGTCIDTKYVKKTGYHIKRTCSFTCIYS